MRDVSRITLEVLVYVVKNQVNLFNFSWMKDVSRITLEFLVYVVKKAITFI